ncbi:hypothetical protein [Mesobacillus maritimus]|uniref:Uncharacterized protein n=1 Tax=Mesobacillus maritimus TaxID=1643336 RepID=A0ABS7K8A9_9BACI|nr:hypothetical protein [Mesobacillus maritimus]MBY0098315.1 hypothetical protein [Mesobacillus maritimus]
MKQTRIFPKVALDMFVIQLVWTGGFLGIMFLINIVKLIIAGVQGNEVEGYFNTIFITGNIYMLIIGLLSIHFLSHYVGNGVTRKDYFIGSFLASIGIAIILPIFTIIISSLEKFVLNLASISTKVQSINEVDIDDNIIGDIVQSIIISPYVDPQDNWIMAISVLALNLYIYYLIGWLISSSFYRFDVMAGIGFILIALNFKMLKDTLLRISLELPVPGWFSWLDFLPSGMALIGVLLIIVVTVWFIRLLTKRIAIKM